ncbi:isochorismatase family protein [Cereibacter changlensis]|uniref:isochorismatase family protein n=1 Tax=Cereibacter changlensis TaxID=402884 RepID=UPI0040339145
MLTLEAARSELLIIDIQTRLMPAIQEGPAVLARARQLVTAADRLGVPLLATEQNPAGLGPTVAGLLPEGAEVLPKMSFDALGAPAIAARLTGDRTLVVAGCEAHVCVLQTVLGLLQRGRRVQVVADAVGSRHAANRKAALKRMRQAGAGIVTTEMVLFEWLGSAEHPAFREIVALIK